MANVGVVFFSFSKGQLGQRVGTLSRHTWELVAVIFGMERIQGNLESYSLLDLLPSPDLRAGNEFVWVILLILQSQKQVQVQAWAF